MSVDHSFWKNRRVLVTGHNGFKGSWLTLWLLSLGSVVHGISLDSSEPLSLWQRLYHEMQSDPKLSSNLDASHCDVRNSKKLHHLVSKFEPEVVFHLAAQPLVRQSYTDPLGTWSTNLMGTLNVLECCQALQSHCVVIVITTDKVYLNRELGRPFKEDDELGGHDPYSASKAAVEIATASWRSSYNTPSDEAPNLAIATARAGNVIGGGDWSMDRIVPDCMRSLHLELPITIRNPYSIRPWQHVTDPLHGYLLLAQHLHQNRVNYDGAFNFGPSLSSNKTVLDLVNTVLLDWPGSYHVCASTSAVYEATCLTLSSQKAHNILSWAPRYGFEETVSRTVRWYKGYYAGNSTISACLQDILGDSK
jgi:CDP-glucose 4,6-dehydratase